MVTISSIARARRFRELVALSLNVAGFDSARPRPDKLSEMVAGGGDILGLPESVIVRTSASSFDAADLLREARQLADERGGDTVPLGVQWRPSKSSSEAFVLTDLRGAAVLMKALAAQENEAALTDQLEELEDG